MADGGDGFARRRAVQGGGIQRAAERDGDEQAGGEHQQGDGDAGIGEAAGDQRQEQHLPHRATGRNQPGGGAAAFGREGAGDAGHRHAPAEEGGADAGAQADAEHDRPGRRKQRRQGETEGIHQAAEDLRPGGAAPIGHRAGDRLEQAPGEVMHGDGQGGVGDGNALGGQRHQQQAEGGAAAERERQRDRAGQQSAVLCRGVHRCTSIGPITRPPNRWTCRCGTSWPESSPTLASRR